MNTSIRLLRPDLTKRFEAKIGQRCDECFGGARCGRKKNGRPESEDMFPFHSHAFQGGGIHAENVGGDIEKMLNKRAIIGAFPWRYEGLEACPCRIVCFEGMDEDVEAVGDVAKAIFQRR